jgi:hypothetical protein
MTAAQILNGHVKEVEQIGLGGAARNPGAGPFISFDVIGK